MSEKQVFRRQGLIHRVSGTHAWGRTHCQCPVALPLNERVVRIYFATRDEQNRSSTTFIESDIERPERVTCVHDRACLSPGELGTFDDCGAMPSWVVPHEGRLYLYYSGWNVGGNVPYRIAIGLAISEDQGLTFRRISLAPVLDRSDCDPSWVAQPCVRKVGSGYWMMWYLSCADWSLVDGRPEPHYNVKFAVSTDGIRWRPTGEVSLDFDASTEAIGRPVVMLADGQYQMYFSYRRVQGYRTEPERAYRLGYAESRDGVHFERRPERFEIAGPRGAWETLMNEYATLYEHAGARYLVYNGDGFGREGMGYAVCRP
jgi:hypothetical protein